MVGLGSNQRRSRWFVQLASAWLSVTSGIISDREAEHNCEPEEARDDHKLSAAGAVLAVHEEQNHQCCLNCCNSQRDHDVHPTEIPARGKDRQERARHQRKENDSIDFRRYDVFRHGLLRSRQMAINQIQQREQINPDDVHEVPVQADIFDGGIVVRVKSSLRRLHNEP